MTGSLTQRSPGTWTLTYDLPRGADGKRQQKKVTIKGNRKEAEKEMRKRLAEIDSGAVLTVAKGTVSEHMEKWLRVMKTQQRSARTIEVYEIVVRRHIIPRLGMKRLETLRPVDIQDFITAIAERGSHRAGQEGKPLAPVTVNHIGTILKMALQLAVDQGQLARNPAARVKLPPAKPKKRSALNEEQIAVVMEACKTSYLYTLVLICSATGMRRSEALALRWQDIDLDTGELHIRQSLVETKGSLEFGTPKTESSARRLVLPEYCRRALVVHRGKQAERRLQMGPIYQDHDLVVTGIDGSPIRPSRASCRFGQITKELGMKDVTLHVLRHSFASLALQTGANLKTLQTVLGHANSKITLDVYAHLLGGEQEEVAQRLDEVLGKAVGL